MVGVSSDRYDELIAKSIAKRRYEYGLEPGNEFDIVMVMPKMRAFVEALVAKKKPVCDGTLVPVKLFEMVGEALTLHKEDAVIPLENTLGDLYMVFRCILLGRAAILIMPLVLALYEQASTLLKENDKK